MKLTDKRFWIVWGVLFVIMVGCCVSGGWSEDMALLVGAYGLSLLSTWLCHRVKPKVVYGNLIMMTVYNAILAYNFTFNSRYGGGMTWWLYALLLNTVHSIALLIYTLVIRNKSSLNRP